MVNYLSRQPMTNVEMRVTFFCRAWKPHYLYSSQLQQFAYRRTFCTMTSAAHIPTVKVGGNASVPVVRFFFNTMRASFDILTWVSWPMEPVQHGTRKTALKSTVNSWNPSRPLSNWVITTLTEPKCTEQNPSSGLPSRKAASKRKAVCCHQGVPQY